MGPGVKSATRKGLLAAFAFPSEEALACASSRPELQAVARKRTAHLSSSAARLVWKAVENLC